MKEMVADAYGKYKEVRNQIKQINNKDLLKIIINFLHSDFNPKRRHHLLLLLLKWSLANYEESNMQTKSIDDRFFRKIMGKLYEFINFCGAESNINNSFKIGGRLLYQQYWLQTTMGKENLARSFFLFSKIAEQDEIKELVVKKTSLTPLEFYQLSFLVFSQFNRPPIQSTSLEDFRGISPILQEKLKLYFSELSLTLLEAKDFSRKSFLYQRDQSKSTLENDQEKEKINQNFYLQIYERSPFIVKPFIYIDDKYWLIAPQLFNEAMKYHLYNIFSTGGKLFRRKFGPIFQDYIEEGLKYTGLLFKTEQQLKIKLPENSKCPDFSVELEDAIIIFEAKATQADDRAQQIQDNDYFYKTLEGSVIKGIIQGSSFAKHAQGLNKKVYLIVVTYKDMYLGPTCNAWDEFIKGKLPDEYTKIIDPQNIYFMSVEDFDLLIKAVSVEHSNLIKILDHVSTQDLKSGYAARFFIRHHIKELFPEHREWENLPYLEEAFDHLDRVANESFK